MEQVIRVLNTLQPKRSLLLSVVVTLGTIIFFWWLSATHPPGTDWGAKSLLPTLFVLTVALISRAPFESLLTGVVAGLIMLDHTTVVTSLADTLSAVMGNETI